LNSACDKLVRLCGKDSFIAVCASVVIIEFYLPRVVINFMAKSAVKRFTSLQHSESTASITAISADIAKDGKLNSSAQKLMLNLHLDDMHVMTHRHTMLS
jgi:hypothetical protein